MTILQASSNSFYNIQKVCELQVIQKFIKYYLMANYFPERDGLIKKLSRVITGNSLITLALFVNLMENINISLATRKM